MKTKFTVILGYISFLGAVGWLVFTMKVAFEENIDMKRILFGLFTFIIPFLCSVLYAIKTKFWKENVSEYYQLKEETKIIQKQIEKRELEIKLSKLNE